MNKFRFTLFALALTAFTLVVSTGAQAQATRTWVSGVGDDANPCSRTAPCKTFAGAISKTAKDGEIDALDDAGYGAVTITKSITIDGDGHLAGILAAGTNGVIINVTDVNDVRKAVRLRNLSINGAGTGLNGIKVLAAKSVYIERCLAYGFTVTTNNDGNGLKIDLAATTNVSVHDSVFENNANDGIRQNISAGTLNAFYEHVVLGGNVRGLEALGGTGNLSRSVVDNNSTEGVSVNNGAVVNAYSNLVTSNGNGFNSINGTIRLGNNNVARNTINAFAGGGTYVTFGNNNVAGNTGNEGLPAATAPK
jgi:hypothetical protein